MDRETYLKLIADVTCDVFWEQNGEEMDGAVYCFAQLKIVCDNICVVINGEDFTWLVERFCLDYPSSLLTN